MFKGTQTITDRKLFQSILKKFFYNKTTYLHSQKGNIEIKFLDSSDGLVRFHIPVETEEPKNCITFARDGSNVIFAFLKFCGKTDDNLYSFNPAKFQVMSVERKNDRKAVPSGGSDKSLIYITNFISDRIIRETLEKRSDILRRIKEIIEYNHFNEYEYLKVFFCSEDINDARMNYFSRIKSPIYISDIYSPESKDEENTYYKKFIYSRDKFLKKHSEYHSEIAVPILFESQIPYGYIQVNNSDPFPRSRVMTVNRMSFTVDELSKKVKLFRVSEDKLLVSDVSEKGVGIVFRNQKYLPYYKKDSNVLLDMLLPRAKKASILADVRHLEMMSNNIIKVGFEIKDMDSKSKDNFESFLGSI